MKARQHIQQHEQEHSRQESLEQEEDQQVSCPHFGKMSDPKWRGYCVQCLEQLEVRCQQCGSTTVQLRHNNNQRCSNCICQELATADPQPSHPPIWSFALLSLALGSLSISTCLYFA